jgi:hypothetical protein
VRRSGRTGSSEGRLGSVGSAKTSQCISGNNRARRNRQFFCLPRRKSPVSDEPHPERRVRPPPSLNLRRTTVALAAAVSRTSGES